MTTTASSCSGRTATSCPTRSSEIEALMDGDLGAGSPKSADLGRAKRIDDVHARYIEFAKRTLPAQSVARGPARRDRLRQWRRLQGRARSVVGAWRRGDQVRRRAQRPQHQRGMRLDRARGAGAKVREVRADIGIALDGDADRMLIVDERGHVIDGDQLMAVIAESWSDDGRVARRGVVATVMSNLGLERHLGEARLDARAHRGRRPLRDRAHARARLQCRRRAVRPHHPVRLSRPPATVSWRRCRCWRWCRSRASRRREVCRRFEPVPQVLRNVRFKKGRPLEDAKVQLAIKRRAEARRPAAVW